MRRSGRTDRNRDSLALPARSCSSTGRCPRDILSEFDDAAAPLAAHSVSRVNILPAGRARAGRHRIDGGRRALRQTCVLVRRSSRASCSQHGANAHFVRAAAAPRRANATPSTAGADAGNTLQRPDLGHRVVRRDGLGIAQGSWRLDLVFALELESCRRRIGHAAPGHAGLRPRRPCVGRGLRSAGHGWPLADRQRLFAMLFRGRLAARRGRPLRLRRWTDARAGFGQGPVLLDWFHGND